MTFADGLLFGIFGMLTTLVGFMIAFVVATKTIEKKNIKKTGPMADLNKNIYGEDCQ